MQAINESGKIIRLPLNKVGDLSKYNKCLSTFEKENERTMTDYEVCNKLCIDQKHLDVLKQIKINSRVNSLNVTVGHDSDTEVSEMVSETDGKATDSELMLESLHIDIRKALSKLTEREYYILTRSLGLFTQEQDLETIGNDLGLTRERVRQIKEHVFKILKSKINSKRLQEYL